MTAEKPKKYCVRTCSTLMFTGSFVAHTKRKDCWQCTSKKRDSVALNKHSSTVGREEMNHILMCLCMPLSINFYFRLRFHMLYYTVVVNQSNAISLPVQNGLWPKSQYRLLLTFTTTNLLVRLTAKWMRGISNDCFEEFPLCIRLRNSYIARPRIVFFFFFWVCEYVETLWAK